jgi:signal transduction histidine kinase
MNKIGIFLSKSEQNYIKQLLEYIQNGEYVFIVSPNGMSRRTIIERSQEELNKLGFNSYYFDLERISYMGVYSLYEAILSEMTQQSEKISTDKKMFEQFFSRLNQYTKNPTVLFFNNIRSIDKEFYDNFAKVCYKIYYLSRNKLRPVDMTQKIVMVFGGFLSDEELVQSALNKITKKVYIKPIPENETKEVIQKNLEFKGIQNPPERLIKWIDHQTSGYHYTITLICYLIATYYPDYSKFDEKQFLHELVHKCIEMIPQESINTDKVNIIDKDISIARRFFDHIIAYLKISENFLRVVLDLIENKSPAISCKRLPAIDHITITGVITRSKNKQYIFSNNFYEQFIRALLKDHACADYCMFHAQNNYFWQKGLSLYDSLKDKKREKYIFHDIDTFSRLRRILTNRLRSCKTIDDLITDFKHMLVDIFDIKQFGIYLPGQQKTITFSFDLDYYNVWKNHWVPESVLKSLLKYIERVWKTQKPLMDWTGKWLAVPIAFTQDDPFERLFLIEINDALKIIQEEFSDFIFTAITIFRNIKNDKRSKAYLHAYSSIADNRSSGTYFFHNDRIIMNQLWAWAKIIFEQIKLKKYYYNEVLPNDYIVKTLYTDRNLQERFHDGEDNKRLIEIAIKVRKSEKRISRIKNNQINYLCAHLDNDVVIILECHEYSQNDDKPLKTCFELFCYMINQTLSENRQRLLTSTLVNQDDCIYFVNDRKRVIFSNNFLNKVLNTDERELANKQCYEALFHKTMPCDDCPIDQILLQNETTPIHVNRNVVLGKKHKNMDCSYIPIWDRDKTKISAVVVHMHDITERQLIWKAIEDIQRLETNHDMENKIIETLKQIGFKRIFQWGPDKMNKKLYISENYKGMIRRLDKGQSFISGHYRYTLTDPAIMAGRVAVRYRPKTPHYDLVQRLRDRLSQTPFDIKPDRTQSVYNPNKMNRPDFWIIVPISGVSGMVKIYVLDNGGDVEKDREMISLEKLQLLDTFSTTVGLILDNTKKRYDYIDKLQAMLTHSSLEPLQLMRMFLDEMVEETDPKERQRMADIADGGLEMVQATLNSLNELERSRRGKSRLEIEPHNISELLFSQTNVFKEYASYIDIYFELQLPNHSIMFSSDKKMIILILNNLIGNSIRYLQKRDDILDKKICFALFQQKDGVIIRISDNGPGFPQAVVDYLKNPFSQENPYPGGGLGIGFSRECANLINGDIRLSPKKPFKGGASLEVILKECRV